MACKDICAWCCGGTTGTGVILYIIFGLAIYGRVYFIPEYTLGAMAAYEMCKSKNDPNTWPKTCPESKFKEYEIEKYHEHAYKFFVGAVVNLILLVICLPFMIKCIKNSKTKKIIDQQQREQELLRAHWD